jgi:hypothetical protein
MLSNLLSQSKRNSGVCLLESVRSLIDWRSTGETMTKTIELSTAKQPLSAYADEFGQDIVVLTLNGRAIAAVVALEDMDLELLSLSLNPEFVAILERARQEFTEGKTLSLEEMKREVLP